MEEIYVYSRIALILIFAFLPLQVLCKCIVAGPLQGLWNLYFLI